MADFKVKNNGAVVDGPVQLKGDQSTSAPMTVEHNNGAAAAGKPVLLTTSAPLFVSPVAGSLDANGKFAFALGPSFGMKGDGTVTVDVNKKKVSFDVRFTD